MPLPGGAAAKVGDRYEVRWSVLCVLDVLSERADSIRFEVPGEEGRGMEFVVRSSDGDTWHQVKRQHYQGHWSPSSLEAEGVLAAIGTRLRAGNRAVFVSMSSTGSLLELLERSDAAASFKEFQEKFLNSKDHKSLWQRLIKTWSISEPKAYEMLGDLEARVIDETALHELAQDKASALIEGDPALALDVLSQLVVDSVHIELFAQDIWNRLAERGLGPSPWIRSDAVLPMLRDTCTSFVEAIDLLSIGRRVFGRPESEQVLEHLREGKDVLVTGPAGYGKSGVLARVIKDLTSDGWPVLVLRADRGLSASGLPGPPARLLAAVSGHLRCVLIIDQLDATSLASGRNLSAFDEVTEVLRESRAFPHLSVVLSARTFDLDNDYRMRALVNDIKPERVDVGLLDAKRVIDLVGDPSADTPISGSLLQLLRVPLNLRLFLELHHQPLDVGEVRNLKELYDLYWQAKRRAVRHRMEGADEWLTIVDRMCEELSRRGALNLPAAVLDGHRDQVDAMASEGVLVARDGQVAFFHETFFDYCFARRFVGRQRTLRGLLEDDDQDLFRRAQVRQVLDHLRGDDTRRYHDDLQWLLQPGHLRAHLRALVVALLGNVREPTFGEWQLLQQVLESPNDPLGERAWHSWHITTPWFRLVDNDGAWERWLSSEEHAVYAVSLLRRAARERPARVSELLRPYVGSGGLWAERLAHLTLDGLRSGADLFDLTHECMRSGDLDEVGDLLGAALEEVAGTHPAPAAALLGTWLERLSVRANGDNPFDRQTGPARGQRSWRETVGTLASAAPAAYVLHVVPFMLDIMATTATGEYEHAVSDQVWSDPHVNMRDELHENLFDAAVDALAGLPAEDENLFCNTIDTLRDSPFRAAKTLAALVHARLPAFRADDAAAWLTRDVAALRLGYSDAPAWISREMIQHISPVCSDETLDALSTAILSFYPEWERSHYGFRQRGMTQFTLLEGLEPRRRTAEVTSRLREWERKFPSRRPTPPQGVTGGFIGPPIPADHATHMSNAQWLGAMQAHKSDRHRIDRTFEQSGGAPELAQVLRQQTAQDPGRFAALLQSMPDGLNAAYPSGILWGLSDASPLPEEIWLPAFRAARAKWSPAVSRWLVTLVENQTVSSLPDEALNAIAEIARSDPDPGGDSWLQDDPSETSSARSAIDSSGLNSSRGSAVRSMARLIDDDHERLALCLPALRSAVRDPVLSVRACTAYALRGVLRLDVDLAIELFLELVDEVDDALLSSNHIEHFVGYGTRQRPQALLPVIEAMIHSAHPRARLAGARQLALASLADVSVDAQVSQLLEDGDERQRMGVIEVGAANIAADVRNERCIELVCTGFHDVSANVRKEARGAFHHLQDARLGPFYELFECFAESAAVQEDLYDFFSLAHRTDSLLPKQALDVAEGFLDGVSGNATKKKPGVLRGSARLSEVLVRIHAQHAEASIRRRCLDLIDQMVLADTYGIDTALRDLNR